MKPLDEFIEKLGGVNYRQLRYLDDKVVSIAGTRGAVRLAHGGALAVSLRQPAAALVRRLIGIGLIDDRAGELTLARMPYDGEAGLLRDLIGLVAP
jgi:hypothetical protein